MTFDISKLPLVLYSLCFALPVFQLIFQVSQSCVPLEVLDLKSGGTFVFVSFDFGCCFYDTSIIKAALEKVHADKEQNVMKRRKLYQIFERKFPLKLCLKGITTSRAWK